MAIKRCKYWQANKKRRRLFLRKMSSGGQGWIRTTESGAGRFTVCSLWPLGNLSIKINRKFGFNLFCERCGAGDGT